jgi:hypothetical protein
MNKRKFHGEPMRLVPGLGKKVSQMRHGRCFTLLVPTINLPVHDHFDGQIYYYSIRQCTCKLFPLSTPAKCLHISTMLTPGSSRPHAKRNMTQILTTFQPTLIGFEILMFLMQDSHETPEELPQTLF